MTNKQKLVTLGKTDYTFREANALAGYIHDALVERNYVIYDVVKVTEIIAGFATTMEAWEEGRKDLKELGTFIADAYLNEFVDVRKGIFI